MRELNEFDADACQGLIKHCLVSAIATTPLADLTLPEADSLFS